LIVGEARWIGPGQVLVPLDETMVLDLASGKLHYLVAKAGPRNEEASPDGRILIAVDDEHFVWAERR
jgi:hypothetical protein